MGVATLRSYEVAGIPEDFTIEPLNCMSNHVLSCALITNLHARSSGHSGVVSSTHAF